VSVRDVVNLLRQDDAGEQYVVEGKADDENIDARQRTSARELSVVLRSLPDTSDHRHVAGDRGADPDRQQSHEQLVHRRHAGLSHPSNQHPTEITLLCSILQYFILFRPIPSRSVLFHFVLFRLFPGTRKTITKMM